MPSSKNMEKELQQAIKETGHHCEWRTATNGGPGYWVLSFPEGKIIREIEGSKTLAVSLSPDATKIAFFQARSSSIEALVEPMDLMMEDVNTGIRQPLGLVARSTSHLSWSPDGKKLALIACEASTNPQVEWPKIPLFSETHRPDKFFIFSIADKTLDTLDLQSLNGLRAFSDQIWSPKGDEIVYEVLYNTAPPLDVEIRILSLSTKTIRSLGRGTFPAWSPTRNQIVFCGPDENYYLINGDGSDKKLLLKSNKKVLYDIVGPVIWSPNGQWLLVAKGAANDTVDLFVMDPETKVMAHLESQTRTLFGSWKGK